jgi:fatty-acyl-CoA synthase
MHGDDSGKSSLAAWTRALALTAPITQNPASTFPTRIDELADQFGASPALISDDAILTYRALSEQSNQYGRWALQQGLVTDDTVCLVMTNCPAYLTIWTGITRTGAVVALVNSNLASDSLAHAIATVAPKHIIVGAECADAVRAVLPRLPRGVICWSHGPTNHDFQRLDLAIENLSPERIVLSGRRPPTLGDRALYIYTSGTTGLPKAAVVSHHRVMRWSYWFAGLMDTKPADRMYNCLPMYHSVGGVVAVGATLVSGGSVVLRPRFSAREFWDDIVEWDCTLFQYIGELCRFLVNSPPHPRERDHHLRLCCGNGLSHATWTEFQERFRIPRILEFYAATEANFSLYNCEGRPGAIGRVPSFLAHRFPIRLVKCDAETSDPLRGADGFCVGCPDDEIGEAIAKIPGDASLSGGSFEGYSDASATDRKVLRNVFVPDDAWFRSGDLMRKDAEGFYYFVDRLGDTYRWKGENVSTTEVADVIGTCPGVIEAVVFGVKVPGAEGRAGMAAVVVDATFDRRELHRHLAARLPDYAQPLFLRITSEIELTGTFRPRKPDLARSGFDPTATSDSIYFHDPVRETFVELDNTLFESLNAGRLRL